MYIPLLGVIAGAQPSPDALYADREHLASATSAAAIWSERLKGGQAYEPAWKLARVCYWLGTHAPEAERRGYLETGVEAGRQAAAIEPARPEGHFWAAATMGALAENYGLRVGLRYRRPIREELETVLRIDPSFMQGSADRALGRYYFKVPALFGGSRSRAEAHLRASLAYDPGSTISHYFLAEVLIADKRRVEARAELQRVIDAPLSEQWAPEDREYKREAAALLASLHD